MIDNVRGLEKEPLTARGGMLGMEGGVPAWAGDEANGGRGDAVIDLGMVVEVDLDCSVGVAALEGICRGTDMIDMT